MTTLKQILLKTGIQYYHSTNIIIPCVKEWLQQKQQEKKRKTRVDDSDDDCNWAQRDMLDELLEELEQ